jgi:hypothetical protein
LMFFSWPNVKRAGIVGSDSLYRVLITLWHCTLPQTQWFAVSLRVTITVKSLMIGGCR